MNVVPCLTWVKRGVAKQQPDRVHLADDDITELIQDKQNTQSLGGAESTSSSSAEDVEDGEASANANPSHSQGQKRKKRNKSDHKPKEENSSDSDSDSVGERYGLDDYDEDNEQANPLDIAGLAFYSKNTDDPYLSRRGQVGSDDSDEDDVLIDPDDNLIALGKAHGDYCNLEVWVYNEKQQNLYCHHDAMLPSFPLCLEWLDFDPGDEKPGSFIAVGNLTPDIEIWDIDVIDTLEPAFTLAGKSKKKKKKLKPKKQNESSSGHSDSVLDLSWNKLQRNVLSSGSADFTIGLWDLQEGKMVSSLTHHVEKVQALQWHPAESHMLLSGSFDGTAKVFDCRSPDDSLKSWTLPGEVERVLWNANNPFMFFGSCETGHVCAVDVRSEKPLFTLSAHNQAVTCLSQCSFTSSCLVTASDDKTVKVWDIKDNKPSMVLEKNMGMGALHCGSFSPDSPLIMALGGEREMRVLNLQKNVKIASHFSVDSDDQVEGKETTETDLEEMSAKNVHRQFDSGEEESDDGAESGSAAVGKTKSKKKKKKKKKSNEKK